jgi:hypothetical protein
MVYIIYVYINNLCIWKIHIQRNVVADRYMYIWPTKLNKKKNTKKKNHIYHIRMNRNMFYE